MEHVSAESWFRVPIVASMSENGFQVRKNGSDVNIRHLRTKKGKNTWRITVKNDGQEPFSMNVVRPEVESPTYIYGYLFPKIPNLTKKFLASLSL